jgi:hypothetical protein
LKVFVLDLLSIDKTLLPQDFQDLHRLLVQQVGTVI